VQLGYIKNVIIYLDPQNPLDGSPQCPLFKLSHAAHFVVSIVWPRTFLYTCIASLHIFRLNTKSN
jgi:hypothetical protein